MGKLPMRARLATTLGGAAGTMSRLAGRGDGSVIGGVIGGLIIVAAHPFIRFLAGSRRGKRIFDYLFAGLMGTFAARLLLMEGH